MTDKELQLRQRSLSRNLQAGAAAIFLLLGGVGGWAATTELSSAIITSGALVIEGNAKKVQHPEGGIIAKVLVEEGQKVKAGETVVRMDDTIAQVSLATVEKNITQLMVRQARLEAERDEQAEITISPELQQRLQHVDAQTSKESEWHLFKEREASRKGKKARLLEQINQLNEQIKGLDIQQQAKADEIKLIGKELKGQRKLLKQGLTSLSRVNKLDRSAARLHGERGQLISYIASTRGRIAEIELLLLQVDQDLRTEVVGELRNVKNTLALLKEDEVAALNSLKHSKIKAPIAGTVHLLSVHTVGGVISTAETLMEIVPDTSRLVAEVRISPRDIDQVVAGQSATLRLSAFNRNTTPELTGSVLRVSADLEADKVTGTYFYRAAITIPEDEIQRLPKDLSLLPGMPAEAFILSGERTVLSYLTKPIADHVHRVFRDEI